ncbi:MAG: hypothetical protein ACP5NY_00990 [Thermocladium sp.]
MDEVGLVFLVGVLIGDGGEGGAVYAPYKQYMDILSRWVNNPEALIKGLSEKGKLVVQKHGSGYRVALMDLDAVGRARALLMPPSREAFVKVMDEAIRQSANPLTGYADIGSVIKIVSSKLGIDSDDAEEMVIKAVLGSKSYILAYGGSRRIKVGSSYYGLIKKVN